MKQKPTTTDEKGQSTMTSFELNKLFRSKNAISILLNHCITLDLSVEELETLQAINKRVKEELETINLNLTVIH